MSEDNSAGGKPSASGDSWGSRVRPLFWYSSLALLLSAVSVFLYYSTFSQPFVQDDWTVLHEIRTTPVFGYLADAFSPVGKVLYRPLTSVVFLLTVTLFGANPFPYHLLAILLHIANGVLGALTVERITGHRGQGAAVAILYAASTTIHADTLLWMVGFSDLGAHVLFLFSLLFYLDRRVIISAVFYLLALLFKESAAPLLLVFVAHALLLDRPRLRVLWGHGLVLAAYGAVRLLTMSGTGMDPAHPYSIDFTGTHIIGNAGLLLSWAHEALLPFFPSPSPQHAALVGSLALSLGVFVAVLRHSRIEIGAIRKVLFFVVWTVSGVASVLPLTHHLFRYYAVYSLVPLFTLAILYGETLIPRRFTRYAGHFLLLFLFLVVAGNRVSFTKRLASEPSAAAVYDGTNHLIRKGAVVRSVQTQMLLHYPSLPDRTRLVFSGIEIDAFGRSFGPQLWYGDSTLEVYTRAEFDSLSKAGALDGKESLFVMVSSESLLHQH